MFGLLNLAMADGYVATFQVKYDLLFWRPVTAIRLADTDGNDQTAADPGWKPLREVPPIPDHDSGHAVEGGAAAAALRGYFGTDRLKLLPLQLHRRGEHVRGRLTADPALHPALSGGPGERVVAGPDRLPLPARDDRRSRPRHRDRRTRRRARPATARLTLLLAGREAVDGQRARRPAA